MGVKIIDILCMKNILITGASSGLGEEFAYILAPKAEVLVLTARSVSKLENVKLKSLALNAQLKVVIIGVDLSQQGAAEQLYQEIIKKGLSIDTLINNAGVGDYGLFQQLALTRQTEMINLNATNLVALTRLVLPNMVAKKHGYVLNVASTAAFQPGPLMAVYYASKAFVLSFSWALREELSNQGVRVSVLCPGPTQTAFEETANLKSSKLFTWVKPMLAGQVVKIAYQGMLKNKGMIIPGLMNKITAWSTSFFPYAFTVKVVHYIQGQK